VFEKEPLPSDAPLRHLPNAYLTPHRSGGLWSSPDRALTWLTDNLDAFLNGHARRFAVTEEMLPSFPDQLEGMRVFLCGHPCPM